jgi:hypothetical protein
LLAVSDFVMIHSARLCQPEDGVVTRQRDLLAANRLDIMLQAVKLFARREKFLCNGERRTKAQFEGVGPKRTA